jgi:hypothetical protein
MGRKEDLLASILHGSYIIPNIDGWMDVVNKTLWLGLVMKILQSPDFFFLRVMG